MPMIAAPKPANESQRVKALAALDILDTPREEGFDAIVRLAAIICDVPTAIISLMDAERQWFKARINLDLSETPRDIAFCAHTILQESPLVVTDTLEDRRFRENPLVTGGPRIRFYAGQRLMTPDGHAVGTLCMIDDKPRALTDTQLEALQALAAQAASLLELRLRVRQLESEVRVRKQAELAAEIARRVADDARQAAEAASRAKSEFLSRMSHELRTPLNAIIGFANVLRKNPAGELSERSLIHLMRIRANGEHLLRLINDILDLAKVEAGRDQISFGTVDLGTLVQEVMAELEGRVVGRDDEDRLALRAVVPARLSIIESDALRLKQIIINLVGNALKFTARGSVTVHVVADAAHTPVRIDVVDTGIGIPADRLGAIFEAFEQADCDTSRRYGGTGLGLAISSSLAKLLGYRIGVSSVVGEGSTFSVHLLSGVGAASAA